MSIVSFTCGHCTVLKCIISAVFPHLASYLHSLQRIKKEKKDLKRNHEMKYFIYCHNS